MTTPIHDSRTCFLPTVIVMPVFGCLDYRQVMQCSLVCRVWQDLIVNINMPWKEIFAKTPVLQIEPWRNAALKHGPRLAAIAACAKAIETSPNCSAKGNQAICLQACKDREFKTASQCQKWAEEADPLIGIQTMVYLITHQVQDTDFKENAENLIKKARGLIEEDREFGLQALMTIAKKYADLGLFDIAMNLTEEAEQKKTSMICLRVRKAIQDVHPYNEMGWHLVNLEEFDRAKLCAQKLDKTFFNLGALLAKIVVMQLKEQNILDTSLLTQLDLGNLHWAQAYEQIVFILLDHHREEEAKTYAQVRLAQTTVRGLDKFKDRLKERGIEY